jgi:hypothetical protein
VGRERVEESLVAIDGLRASLNLPPLDPALLKLDPYRSIDVRLTKGIRIGAARRLEMLLEGFNVTNHVNFRSPAGNINSNSFLRRTTARDARQIQWGLRYLF